jgi:hypothetical protein
MPFLLLFFLQQKKSNKKMPFLLTFFLQQKKVTKNAAATRKKLKINNFFLKTGNSLRSNSPVFLMKKTIDFFDAFFLRREERPSNIN